MAYDEVLVERVRERLETGGAVSEKKVFGAVTFLLRGNTLGGVEGDDLFLRVAQEDMADALARPGARPYEFKGRVSKGWVYVAGEALDDDALEQWLQMALEAAAELPPK
ncbi:TfoX/Sxy family protein [Streptomyces sp. TLI_146]|uniref:TfoX/Sxy family protein n=1 Tax=Streptomyces sp. TLI_146 TaxID=1938858 RepID=UPI000C714AE8|nr:TfoX/Sxy family protein [Streptomyces sp. TLI_146]PKV90099.1 TfoX/Sxy family transcriptional regulator of competence genes [Streptomyces sp. TLI_146]